MKCKPEDQGSESQITLTNRSYSRTEATPSRRSKLWLFTLELIQRKNNTVIRKNTFYHNQPATYFMTSSPMRKDFILALAYRLIPLRTHSK